MVLVDLSDIKVPLDANETVVVNAGRTFVEPPHPHYTANKHNIKKYFIPISLVSMAFRMPFKS